MNELIAKLIVIVGAIAVVIFFSFLLSWPVMALWNDCLVDAVEGVKQIGWMQAWGISVLFGLLFKTQTVDKK
jgi:hypothetical protein